jgi:ribonuclease HIII
LDVVVLQKGEKNSAVIAIFSIVARRSRLSICSKEEGALADL